MTPNPKDVVYYSLEDIRLLPGAPGPKFINLNNELAANKMLLLQL